MFLVNGDHVVEHTVDGEVLHDVGCELIELGQVFGIDARRLPFQVVVHDGALLAGDRLHHWAYLFADMHEIEEAKDIVPGGRGVSGRLP
jgi:hypothetical protein